VRTDHYAVLAVFVAAMAASLAADVALPPAGSPAGFKTVIVMGDSRTDGCVGEKKTTDCRQHDVGFDRKVLAQLLRLAAGHRPAAVFFTGDLTLGLEKEEAAGVVDPGDTRAAGGWARDFEYDSKTFERMITAFKRSVTATLGTTAFYPLVGNHDTVGPDALDLFRRNFGLEHPPEGFNDPSHLAYVMTVGTAAFFAIATDYYTDCLPGQTAPACNLQQHQISQPQLDWLDQALARHAGQRLFVVGHEPAFSAGGKVTGLDADPVARDAFWAVLRRRGVVAYICSHQHRYDLSQHGGVWQIVSGGAGADLDSAVESGAERVPLDQCTGGKKIEDASRDTSFFHYLSLRIPDDPKRVAVATIRDCRERTRAMIPLTPAAAPSATRSAGERQP
jgi:hypothetical protein